ncbi:MAG: mechanosensitive ion channel family protein [Desulfobacca sp.]|nr:mechanosensitive ion channel family protein [Desulfobacca sp.]
MIPLLVLPVLASILSVVLLGLVRTICLRFLSRFVDSTGSKAAELTLLSLKTPSYYWCLAIGLFIGLGLSEPPTKYTLTINKLIEIILILSISLAAANLSGALLRNYIQKMDIPIPTTGLAFGIIKGSILSIGFLIILSSLGIAIAPMITALGVGGLAVALALQDTLSNLFAGMHVLLEKSIRIGDFIRLESGLEGRVDDITWRTTRIRMLSNNMVIIPNNKLSQSVVTNYSLPEKRMSLQIPVSVSYETDPEKVEFFLNDEACKAVHEVEGILADPAPTVMLNPVVGANSLDFILNCQIEDVVNQTKIVHEFRKRIITRLKKEGIEIPYPQKIMVIGQEKKD